MTRPAWDPRNLPDLTGRAYLVTGSNAGLGYFSCEQLARAGAHVVMTGRNPNRLASARAALTRRVPGASLESLMLDTSNFGSIRAAAATVRTRRALDGILLNAGIVHPPKERRTTSDGNELVFATNVLGHFALAGEMLTTLAAREGRIVWVGSIAPSLSRGAVTDPQLVHDYSAWRAYVQSKAGAMALGFEADRRLREAGVHVQSVVAHPGYSTSGRTPGIAGVNTPSRMTRFVDNLQGAITQSKEHGAWSLVRALVDPDVSGGEYWGPRRAARGIPHRARPASVTTDRALAELLWRTCQEATGVRWPFEKAARVRVRR